MRICQLAGASRRVGVGAVPSNRMKLLTITAWLSGPHSSRASLRRLESGSVHGDCVDDVGNGPASGDFGKIRHFIAP